MKASDLFVKCLENEGVEYIFSVPGEENLDLIDSVRKSSIKLIVTRHEQHAAFMAATYGRLTGLPGVCLSTLGPGATNLVTGLAYAQLGGMPLVAITGQKAVKDNWQGTFQIVDVVSTFRPLTKWNTSIISARTIPRFVSHAFKEAGAERPGPVHIELPEDVAGEDVPDDDPFPHRQIRRPVAGEKVLDQAVEMIRGARRPVMLVSAGANRKRIGRQLVNFLEKTGIYAVSTQMGKGVLTEDHPQSLFSLGIHKKDYVNCALEDADLVITVGYNIVEFPPFVWNESKDKRILHIDFVMAEPDVYYRPELEVVGDISHALWAIHSRIGDVSFDNAHHAELRKIFDEKLHVKSCTDCFPIKPQCLVHGVREVMNRDGIACLDNGIYKIWFARQYKTYRDNTLLLDNALATMGAGLASAMAAKIVMPGRQVLAVAGDGGFMMNSQDLETAVRLGQDLVILLVRDDAYGFIRWKQAQMGLEDFGMTFGNPDFVKYAEAYGAVGMRVGKGDSFVEVLGKAFETASARSLPVLVDCPIDYSQNVKLERDLHGEVSHILACAVDEQGDDA
ncbi:MAG: acetolactate synthase large subunit [Deltaproteobacteria bacterium]|nr:acetolactate synthase large subunit [Deltaproteobacteria bacterium]